MEGGKGQFRHVCVLGLIALAMSLLLSAGGEAAEQPQYGGVLRIIDVAEGAQPIGTPWGVMGVDSDLIKPVIETLIREDIKGGYHPWLATSWKVDMAKNTITLSLRKGVKFHDGTDFNAMAAKWNLDQMIKAKTVKGFLSVDIADDYTIRINVEKYQNNHLNYLCASYGGAMISPAFYEKNDLDFVRWHPVGTGPFKFVKFDRGARLTYAKWEGYWQKGRPYLDGIEYLFIRDPMTQQAAMRASGSERAHVLYVNSGEQAAMMSQGFRIMSGFVGATTLIPDSANADSPLSNKKVREAVSLAIDREAIVKARGFGFWAPTIQIPSPQNSGYVASLGAGQYDPKKAKQLLAEAGYPNGFKIKLIPQPALVDRDAVVAVQRFLGEVGIQCDTEFPDGGGYMAYRFKGGWHNAFMVQAVRMLATTNLYNNFMWNSPGMWPSLKRPEGFQEKIVKSLETLMPEKAKMEELTKIQAEDWMIIPLYRQAEIYILQPNVHDTGFLEWSAATVCTPETMWMGK